MENEFLTIDTCELGAVSVNKESVLNDPIYGEIFEATRGLQYIVKLRNNEGTKANQLEAAEHSLRAVKSLLAQLEEEMQTRRL